MDPRNRANELLARARARSAFVVTPDNMTSPMDASSTVRIPRAAMPGQAGPDAESTVVISHPAASGQPTEWPQQDHQQGSGYAALSPEPPQPPRWPQPGQQQYPQR